MSLFWIVLLMVASFVLVIYTSLITNRHKWVAIFFWVIIGIGISWILTELWSNWPELEVPSGFFWFTLLLATSYAITMYLILRSGIGYSVEDAESHSIDYGGVIKEGHGGLTAFLWVSYAVIFIWTIVYLIQHWSEFGVIFSY